MEKKIEDYLHFYIGCEYKSLKKDIPDGTMVGFSIHPDVDCKFVDISFIDPDDNKEITIPTNCFDEIKPILRPLSDITEAEEDYASLLWETEEKKNSGFVPYNASAEMTCYLLSKHFDLFRLIESGLAIDKTKI